MERPLIYIGVIAALLAIAIIWGSQQPERLTPLEALERSAQELDAACASACAGTPAAVTMAVPAGTRMYATDEAICLQRNTSMFCARCPCPLVPGDLPTSTGMNVTCAMGGEPLQVSCK